MNTPPHTDTSPDGENIEYKLDLLSLFCNHFVQFPWEKEKEKCT